MKLNPTRLSLAEAEASGGFSDLICNQSFLYFSSDFYARIAVLSFVFTTAHCDGQTRFFIFLFTYCFRLLEVGLFFGKQGSDSTRPVGDGCFSRKWKEQQEGFKSNEPQQLQQSNTEKANVGMEAQATG